VVPISNIKEDSHDKRRPHHRERGQTTRGKEQADAAEAQAANASPKLK